MAKRVVEEIFGPSVLDLVCGLFGLLVVLYSTTNNTDGTLPVESRPINFINVEAKNGSDVNFIISFEIDQVKYSNLTGCEPDGPIIWACRPHELKVLIGSEIPPEKIMIAARDFDVVSTIEAKVSVRNGCYKLILGKDNFFRSVVDDSNC